MTGDQDAFLRTICEYPFDLRPRLVYADWLDENDDGANGFAARAEFIRLSCEIATALRPGMDIIDSPEFGRQEVLFSDHIMRWRMECAVNLLPHWAKRNHYTGDVCAIWRSGFVEEIRCPLDWWIGDSETCPHCDPFSGLPLTHERRNCPGTPANGPSVVSRQPVTRVAISDREPWLFVGDRAFGWFREDGVTNYRQQYDSRRRVGVINSVPAAVFALFPRRYGDQTETYPTAEAAVDALSRALVDWARKKAGLMPITWEVTS